MDVQTILDHKDCPDKFAEHLTKEDIAFLFSLLSSKNDEIRYICFLTLQNRSRIHDDVYAYFDLLAQKLTNSNSYQRNIGLILIAENIKWDAQDKFTSIYDEYAHHFNDEKFITSRQAIQNIPKWITYRPGLTTKVATKLMSIDLSEYKNSQSPLLLCDIFEALLTIYKLHPSDNIKDYLLENLNTGILNKANTKKFAKILSSL
jgi:hypothetical protein